MIRICTECNGGGSMFGEGTLREIKQFRNEELDKVWENANFGNVSKRDVILETLSSIVRGYHSGHTSMCICTELRLIKDNGKGNYYLTDLGLEVLLSNKKDV